MKEIQIDTSKLIRRIEGILKNLAEARIISSALNPSVFISSSFAI